MRNERPRREGRSRRIAGAALILLFAVAAFLWAWGLMRDRLGNFYTPDSYCCFLLGKNVFDGLGFTTYAVRDLFEEPAWPIQSRSFPPLYPFLVGAWDHLTGSGIQSGTAINLIVLFAALLAVAALGRALVRGHWPLVALAFLFFFRKDVIFQDEVCGARSIPLSILLYLVFLYVFVRSLDPAARRRRWEALGGGVLGLLCLARFDQVAFALLAPAFVFAAYRAVGFPRREALAKAGWMGAALALSYAPWAIRCLALYGTPFASNNTLAVLSVHQGEAPLSFFAPGAEPGTIFTDTGLWLRQRLAYLVRNWHIIEGLVGAPLYGAPVAALVAWRRMTGAQRAAALLCGGHAVLLVLSITLTPYGDSRYWSQIHLGACLVLAVALVAFLRASAPGRVRVAVIGLIAAAFLVGNPLANGALEGLEGQLFAGRIMTRNDDVQRRFYGLVMRPWDPIIEEGAVIAPFQHTEVLTYYTGRRAVTFPFNLRRLKVIDAANGAFRAWLERWRPDYLLLLEPHRKPFGSFLVPRYVVPGSGRHVLLDARRILADMRAGVAAPVTARTGRP